ncbi:MAG: response regulator transcription factor [Verrucomicrobia bacterium]|nr:response regulator transcription factor [Verrucomicrobiota bacterium]
MTINVCIIEDDDPLRRAYVAILNGTDGFRCVGDFRTAESALEKLPLLKPDVVLVDLVLPHQGGIECIRKLKVTLGDATRFLALTVTRDPQTIFAALEAGASGYLVKGQRPAKILEAIEEVHGGGAPMSSAVARLVIQFFHGRGQASRELASLTPREEEILGHLAEGRHDKEIAAKLGCQVRTIAAHCHNIYEKLHVHSRAAAVAKYLRQKD